MFLLLSLGRQTLQGRLERHGWRRRASRLVALTTALFVGPLILYGLFFVMVTLSPPPPELPGNDAIRPAIPRFTAALAIATAWTLALHELLRGVIAALRNRLVARRA